MPACSVPGCSNRPEKGFLMKVFPKDPIRRQDWTARLKRENWVPTNSSCICEVHFEPHMWEKTREDGSRRLKTNAVPTLFMSRVANNSVNKFYKSCFSANKQNIDQIGNQTSEISNNSNGRFSNVQNYISARNASEGEMEGEPETEIEIIYIPERNNLGMDVFNDEVETTCIQESSDFEGPPSDSPSYTTNDKTVHPLSRDTTTSTDDLPSDTDDKLDAVLHFRVVNDNRRLRKKNKLLQARIRELNREVDSLRSLLQGELIRNSDDKSSQLLHTVFNKDQISALENTKTFKEWSDSTIEKALRLKLLCGVKGYQEILKQNFPFPSLQTLQKKEASRLQNEKPPQVLV